MILELEKDRITLYFWSVDWKANILSFVDISYKFSVIFDWRSESPRDFW